MVSKDEEGVAKLNPAAELYVWGYPLAAVHRTRQLFCSRSKTGAINHVDDLATPADKGIVAPNNDTLYSSGWYDLALGDLEIDVPPMDHAGRYWNVMILDAFTHVAYVRRRHHGVNGARVAVTYDPTTAPVDDGGDLVSIGTPTAWVIIRVLVDSDEDMAEARTIQRAITVKEPEKHPHQLTERAGRPTAIAKTGIELFTELKRYVEQDPPALWHTPLSEQAKAILANPDQYPEQELLAGIEQGEKLLVGGNTKNSVIRNGWSSSKEGESAADDHASALIQKAVGAKFGLGGHLAIENRSYIALMDAEKQKLDGRRSLTLRLDADDMPPCDGFWSLTAYGMDLYLVENEIDRWSLGDRTPGLEYEQDGSLVIVLSHQKPSSSANWLPVPEGPYMLGLRVYEGHESVVDCAWFPPDLEPTEL